MLPTSIYLPTLLTYTNKCLPVPPTYLPTNPPCTHPSIHSTRLHLSTCFLPFLSHLLVVRYFCSSHVLYPSHPSCVNNLHLFISATPVPVPVSPYHPSPTPRVSYSSSCLSPSHPLHHNHPHDPPRFSSNLCILLLIIPATIEEWKMISEVIVGIVVM